MAYNRKNHLKKVIRVLELYNKYKQPHLSDRFIFITYVKVSYDISESSFRKWLTMPNPKNQLKKLEDEPQNNAESAPVDDAGTITTGGSTKGTGEPL